MDNNIANQNAKNLARTCTAFCAIHNLTANEELVPILSTAMLFGCAEWCAKNGVEFNPAETLIPEEAIMHAFCTCQEIAVLARSAVNDIGLGE